jgi:DNA-binding NtrC family response regulator
MPVQQTTVAIIDDDPGMLSATASLLSAFGYGTETFGSGEEFLNVAATSAATCLLVDIKVGRISGLDLVRRLAAAGFKLPVIFMTGGADEAIRAAWIANIDTHKSLSLERLYHKRLRREKVIRLNLVKNRLAATLASTSPYLVGNSNQNTDPY